VILRLLISVRFVVPPSGGHSAELRTSVRFVVPPSGGHSAELRTFRSDDINLQSVSARKG